MLAALGHASLDLGQQLAHAPLVVLVIGPDPHLCQLQAGEMLGVATELDVHTAAGHVRGDRHRSRLAGLGDDLGLARGVLGLGVQHRVLDPHAPSSAHRSSSETSTEIVPTSTGWPFSWRAAISLATALHLPSLVL